MAGLSFPVVHTVAGEVIDQVHTLASILTRVPVALVYVWNKIKQTAAVVDDFI